MGEPTRASEALDRVRANFPKSDDFNGHLTLIDSWVEGPDTICLVYEGWWFPGRLGLRRRIASHLEVWQEVANILNGELGEPVGGMVEGVEPDAHGITWWEGDLPEWREYQ